MVKKIQNNLPAIPVPSSRQELLDSRKSTRQPSLIDVVVEVFPELWENDPDFPPLFAAVDKSQTVEGSFDADNYAAAGKVRGAIRANGYGRTHGNAPLLHVKTATLHARRHYGLGLKQRRNQALALTIKKEEDEAGE